MLDHTSQVFCMQHTQACRQPSVHSALCMSKDFYITVAQHSRCDGCQQQQSTDIKKHYFVAGWRALQGLTCRVDQPSQLGSKTGQSTPQPL